jgi:NAD-dependent dihydropyrimidine dehydrogenase PreA subunit
MDRERVIKSEWTTDKIGEMLDKYKPITIPVSISVSGKQKILGFSEAERILRKAKLISLERCSCRVERKNCDGPLDVCVCMDEEAEEAIRERNAWKTTHEKALDALRIAHKAGLVHLAFETKGRNRIKIICSCCACCCQTLAAITRFGYNHEVVQSSDVIAARDTQKCTSCGICVQRCHFDAWGLVGDDVHHYTMKCGGCGICASFCPTGAITMVKRSRVTGVRERPKKRPQSRNPDRRS